MGKRSQILLVVTAFAACLAGCTERDAHGHSLVAPQDHDAFFLWAGVEPDGKLATAKTIYILSGEVRCGEAATFESLRATPDLGQDIDVWLVVRTACLDWGQLVERRIMSDLARWSRSNRVVGLQIDYDSPTNELAGYAAFMSELRNRLPRQFKLSATGLMDWSAQGDPAALSQLGKAIDEVVIQTYRGRRTITNYRNYADSLQDLPLPYHVGLVENGTWSPPEGLEDDPEFRGYVVFLLND